MRVLEIVKWHCEDLFFVNVLDCGLKKRTWICRPWRCTQGYHEGYPHRVPYCSLYSITKNGSLFIESCAQKSSCASSIISMIAVYGAFLHGLL